MKYRTKDLLNFIETTNHRTITEAAKSLQMTQPSLSQSLSRLEKDFGAAVFYRSRTGVELTPNGQILLQKARSLFEIFNSINSIKNQNSTLITRRISIGCHPTVASYTLPKALSLLKKKHMNFQFSLEHDLSRNIQLKIQNGKIDLGIIVNPTPMQDLIIRHVATDKVCVWKQQKTNKLDTVIYDGNLIQSQFILKRWKNLPKKTIETNNLELIARLTAEGVGYGILPQRVIALIRSHLVKVKKHSPFLDKISIVYRPEFGKSFFEQTLIQTLKESLNS